MQDDIVFRYLAAKQLGLNDDIRKQTYNGVDKITMADLKNFHAANFAGKPYTYALVASEKKMNMDDLKRIGEVKKISLEELFGY
ncbi:hypothetical protein MTP09_12865 [Chryseobacterium suipulveris]|uniref:Uncharacterized protein n=1 Tax=Chryseobacterium suipulveris TaxID=2929800 RepID=A0ABY4BNM9_9FLAO|nr:hypothetical protein [Chryseobacterium suipulveris]UOE40782.1 hypothetical protein MTP09_12865 [Chryseobacterium suipulveris]